MDSKQFFLVDGVCRDFEDHWREADPGNPPDLIGTIQGLSHDTVKASLPSLLAIDREFREAHDLPNGLGVYQTVLDIVDADAEGLWEQVRHERHSKLISVLPNEYQNKVRIEPDGRQKKSEALDVTIDTSGTSLAGDAPTFRSRDQQMHDAADRRKIGRFTILSKLGKGGQGAVYKALHPELDLTLAIKVGASGTSESERIAMKREAQLLCELDHPHIGRLRDLEFDEQDRPILVLDFNGGRSMQQILEEGPIAIERSIDWLRQAADAIDYTHRRGVTHLDLKPANIVIGQDDKARVIDFGLARLDAFYTNDQKREGIRGTPAFMSPEQAHGTAANITPRADIFALGAILYRVITGIPPFRAKDGRRSVIMAQQCQVDWQLLEESNAPQHLKAACRRALESDPSMRFETAAEFSNAIDFGSIESSSVTGGIGQAVAIIAGVSSILVLAGYLMFFRVDQEPNVSTRRESSMIDLASSNLEPAVSANQLIEDFQITASRGSDTFRSIESIAPLRNGDSIHFSLKLREPAYVRLLWADSSGQVVELYPNDPEAGNFGDTLITSIESPQQLDRGWPLEGEAGWETAFLLVSRDRIASTEFEVPSSRSSIPSSIGLVSRYTATKDDRAQQVKRSVVGLRSLGGESKQVDDAMLQWLEKLRHQAEAVNAIMIPHAPK